MRGGITGACCPDAADILSTSSEMISFILSTASDVANKKLCLDTRSYTDSAITLIAVGLVVKVNPFSNNKDNLVTACMAFNRTIFMQIKLKSFFN